MYLKKLHISNFRCFRDYTIEFAPGVTVLFGKNGSGKSTLIHAIHKALSFAFYKDTKREDALNLGAGFPEIKHRNFDKKEDVIRDVETGYTVPFINIHAEANVLDVDLAWDMYASTSTYNVQPSKFFAARYLFEDRVKSSDSFPVFAYFSDSFPHLSDKADKLTKSQLDLRNLGYLGWDDETAYSDLWITRLTKIWTIWNRAKQKETQEVFALATSDKLKHEGKITDEEYREDFDLHEAKLANAHKELALYDPEVLAIRDCLVAFSKKLPGIDVLDFFVSVYEEDGLCLETKDGQNPPFEKLPAGYKRIFYMALDIAYRSYILNGTTDSEGIVVIDEIDLHLHPALEQVVLQCFQETFPNIQLVVSTHSPLVLTGVETEGKPNVILHMASGDTKPEVTHDIYGIDYNTGIEDVMGVESKNVELDYMVNLCAYMKKRNKIAQAENIMKRILDKFAKSRNEVEKMVEAKEREL